MTYTGDTLRILSHRACLRGPDKATENRLDTLSRAYSFGFDVEFDVNLDSAMGRLVLTHDVAPWSEAKDAPRWLTQPQPGALHALNVKHLYTVPAVCDLLRNAGTQGQFFLFDFELLADDQKACRFLMHSLSEAGFTVAYRLSEREPFFDEYLSAGHIQTLWLDEFAQSWVTPGHIQALRDAGKRTFYVSPDLHGNRDLTVLKQRWETLISAGITGICTDYPLALADFAGVTLPKEETSHD
jgi:glycerophosphoryl diester phosphodiesterase